MTNTNLEIAGKLVESEGNLIEKISSVYQHGMKISDEGIKLNDTAKRNEGLMILSISSTSYYLSHSSGKYINTFFIQSIMKDRSIDNDSLSDTINELVNTSKKDLIHYIDNDIDMAMETMLNPLLIGEDSRKIILDY
ncbi:uncharacterized protein METZ01_LOCUS194272, partial [marine metagenome]